MKRIIFFFTLIFTLLILITHIFIILTNLLPNTLYASIGSVNYLSIGLFVIFVFTIIISMIKKNVKVIYYSILINVILLIPSLIFGILVYPLEISMTEDVNNYLKFDEERIYNELINYFPKELHNYEVENYHYYYVYSPFSSLINNGCDVEVSLEVKAAENEFDEIINELLIKYPNAEVNVCKENFKYQEIKIIDNIVFNNANEKVYHGILKKVIFSKEQGTLIFEYLEVKSNIAYNDLFYVNRIIR